MTGANRERGLLLICAVLSAGILVIDLSLPLGVAGGVPYVFIVLLALRSSDDRVPLAFAVLASLLTLAGLLLSSPLGIYWMVLANRGLALFAIWVTALLGLQLKRVSRRSRANRAQLRELIENLPLGVAAIDPAEGRYRYVNSSYATLFDRPREQLQDRQLAQGHEAELAAQLVTHCSTVPAGGSTTFEYDLPSFDGSLGRRIRIVLALFQREESQGAALITAVVSDISDSTQAAEQLQRQLAELAHVARVSTMGELAAKLAHELNQPLCAITSYTRASLRMMRSGQWHNAELIEALEDASQQAERAADIIRGMRNFLRKSPDSRSAVDLAALAREVMSLIQAEARHQRVAIELDLPDDLPTVHADRTEINQVLFNLLLNGIESCAASSPGPNRVRLSAARDADGGVEISVSDTGGGFVEGVAEHLFDPFFSTRQEGMGMGLSICRTIVEAHGGVLRARNNETGGATFVFHLPVDEELNDDA